MIKNDNISERCIKEGLFLIQQKCSIRECSKVFKISKSTVHLDVSKRLKNIDFLLYEQVKVLLKKNFKNKHIKGGESTRKKFLKNN